MSPSEMIANSQVAAVITDPRLPDNPIIECNDAFVALTGYAREEVSGRNCRFLAGPETEPWLQETIRTGLRDRKPVLAEILNYKKDGTAFRNAVMIAPIFDDRGELEYFLGTQMEVEDIRSGNNIHHREAGERIAGLTPRQRDILIQMAAGKRNKQIAYDTDLTERTVKMHRAALIRALGVRTAAEAMRLAIEAGY